MKIAILYVCTGRYTCFWDTFFRSTEKFFLSNHEKSYFVFTDGDISHTENESVYRIEQENLGWPGNTLLRYHMFLRIADRLSTFDYVFFFNGNAEFCSPVDESFLPEKNTMLFVQHPGFFNKKRKEFGYETNPLSRAYIASHEGKIYICGGVNGGESNVYLSFMRYIAEAVDADSQRNIVAVWHDESHSNRYALDHPYTLRDPGYCYPEGAVLPFEAKILLLDKGRRGGHAYLRGLDDTPKADLVESPKNNLLCRLRLIVQKVLKYIK